MFVTRSISTGTVRNCDLAVLSTMAEPSKTNKTSWEKFAQKMDEKFEANEDEVSCVPEQLRYQSSGFSGSREFICMYLVVQKCFICSCFVTGLASFAGRADKRTATGKSFNQMKAYFHLKSGSKPFPKPRDTERNSQGLGYIYFIGVRQHCPPDTLQFFQWENHC